MVLYDKANWVRSRCETALAIQTIARLVRRAFPAERVATAQLMPGGLANSNYKVEFDRRRAPIVLRIYDRDPAVCQKEVDILRMVSRSVPVPEVFHAEPAGAAGVGPFVLMEYVEGITFRELKGSRDAQATAQAAYSIGAALAAIGRFTFPASGWLGPGPRVTGPLLEGPDSIPRFIDLCLVTPPLLSRMDAEMREQVSDLAWSWAAELSRPGEENHLVHCDFNSPNLLVRRGESGWEAAAVLDWEFAVSGSPLIDIGNFLRYERESHPRMEPHFSLGFRENGGCLPENWRRIAQVMDLTSLCEILTRDEVPDVVVTDVIDLIRVILVAEP